MTPVHTMQASAHVCVIRSVNVVVAFSEFDYKLQSSRIGTYPRVAQTKLNGHCRDLLVMAADLCVQYSQEGAYIFLVPNRTPDGQRSVYHNHSPHLFELRVWDRQTDRQTDRRIDGSQHCFSLSNRGADA